MNILICGDSHTQVFTYANKKQNVYNFIVYPVGGATAQGAVNPNSYTNALDKFSKKINLLPKMFKIGVMLGEVDCGFVIWVRSKRYNISVEEQIDNSINNLFSFIQQVIVKQKGYKCEDIIVIGAILPTIKDNTNKMYLKGVRSEVDVSQKERTNKTIEYNNKLNEISKKKGYKYIDITENIIDKDNGIVKEEYLNNNPYDHHLDSEKTYKLWLNQFDKIMM